MRSDVSYFLMKVKIKILRAGEFLIPDKHHNQSVNSNNPVSQYTVTGDIQGDEMKKILLTLALLSASWVVHAQQFDMAYSEMSSDSSDQVFAGARNSSGSSSTIYQNGNSNLAANNQTGYGNSSVIRQSGSENTAVVNQRGNGNNADISQSGSDNFAYISQSGGGDASITQQNFGNTAYILQKGRSVTEIRQNGTNQSSGVVQNSSGMAIRVTQH